jgi:hypothetical protein
MSSPPEARAREGTTRTDATCNETPPGELTAWHGDEEGLSQRVSRPITFFDGSEWQGTATVSDEPAPNAEQEADGRGRHNAAAAKTDRITRLRAR